MKAFHIVQWDEVHENHDSRKYARLSWVLQPTKHDGLGFRRLTRETDRSDLYAGWCLILQVASKGRKDERGWLVRNGQALDALDLEAMTGFPAGLFGRVLEYFSTPAIGWLEEREFEPNDWARRRAGESPGPAGSSGTAAGESPGSLPVQEDKKTNKSTKRERENGAATLEELKLQWVALTKRIKSLETREDDLEEEEREELKKCRRSLNQLEKKQREGNFT